MEESFRISILVIFLLLVAMTMALRLFCIFLLRPHAMDPRQKGHGFRILYYQNLAQLLFSLGFTGLIALSFATPPTQQEIDAPIALGATLFFFVCLAANFVGAWYGMKMLITRPESSANDGPAV